MSAFSSLLANVNFHQCCVNKSMEHRDVLYLNATISRTVGRRLTERMSANYVESQSNILHEMTFFKGVTTLLGAVNI